MKKCNKCKQNKPLTDFSKRTMSFDGLQVHCKDCQKAANRAGASRRANSEPKFIRQSKVCNDCDLEKPVSQFYVKRNSADKYGSYCKTCWVARVRRSQNRGR